MRYLYIFVTLCFVMTITFSLLCSIQKINFKKKNKLIQEKYLWHSIALCYFNRIQISNEFLKNNDLCYNIVNHFSSCSANNGNQAYFKSMNRVNQSWLQKERVLQRKKKNWKPKTICHFDWDKSPTFNCLHISHSCNVTILFTI